MRLDASYNLCSKLGSKLIFGRSYGSSLVGGPKVIFEISSIGPRIPFSRPKMSPENAWWPHFCEETAPCGRKSAVSPTACARGYITLLFSMFM